MRKLIIIFIFITSVLQAQTNYYVSSIAGDDSDGTTRAKAWRSIAKVNAATFNAGDSILFQLGSTFRETLTVPSSGSSGNHVIFSCYGTGAKPKSATHSRHMTVLV